MMHRTGRGGGSSLAIDFANTVACPGCRGSDPLGSAGEAKRWMRRKLPGARAGVSARDIQDLRLFRERVRQLLAADIGGTPPPPSALVAVNRALARAASRSELGWSGGRWVLEEPATRRLSGSRQWISLVARSTADLLGETRPSRIRRCEGPGCVHFLVAHRSQQRWCSPTGCGNRARVQRHYRKARSGQPVR
jgi:predicted RNA-binding Zn ribbon-like protein